MFQNSPQMKMSKMNRTKNIVLHRMYKKWTPSSASLMGTFNNSPHVQYLHGFFFYFFLMVLPVYCSV